MSKTIVIGGKEFKYGGELKVKPHIGTRSLYDCYKKPSHDKIVAWEGWRDFFHTQIKSYEYEVGSYNVYFFTIRACGEWEGQLYRFDINPSYCMAWKIV